MSAQLEISKDDMDNLNRKFDLLKKEGGAALRKSAIGMMYRILTTAKIKINENRTIKTSRLKNSLHLEGGSEFKDNRIVNSGDLKLKTVTLAGNELAVGTNVEYAAAIELGSRPHVIEAKNKKVLAKQTGDNSWIFFGKRVMHPGFKGKSFLYAALKEVDPEKTTAQLMKEEIATRPIFK
jgi:hypothetical protein